MPASSQQARLVAAAVRKHVHVSLLPYCFRRVGKDNSVSEVELSSGSLARAAGVICKVSGLLVQAYWLFLKFQGQQAQIPSRLDDVLLQLWAGYQRYSEHLSISILDEASLAPQGSPFAALATKPDVLREWKDLLALYSSRYRRFEEQLSRIDISEKFVALLRALPVLQRATIVDGEIRFGGKSVLLFPFFHWSHALRNPLFLYGFEFDRAHDNGAVKSLLPKPNVATISFEDPYSDYAEDVPLTPGTEVRRKYSDIQRWLGLENVPEGILYLFGSGYEHIQNLALALTEIDGPACKKAMADLRAAFWNHYYYEDCPQPHAADFATLLIADRGPMDVMRRVIKRGGCEIYKDFLRYFAERKNGHCQQWEKSYQDNLSAKLKSIDHLFDNEQKDKLKENAELDAQCAIVIRAAGLDIDEPERCVESMDAHLSNFEKWERAYLSSRSAAEVVILVNQLVERILRFLIGFYSGLIEMQKVTEARDWIFAEAQMVRGCQEACRRSSTSSAGTLIGVFRDGLLGNPDSAAVAVNLLGRKTLCSRDTFIKVTDDWTKVVNAVKHDGLGTPTDLEVRSFLDATRSLLTFLRTGSLLRVQQISLEPVYPLVISFREARHKRDGLMIYKYEIQSVSQDYGTDINILTSREYPPNEEYYCLPIFNRSTHKWWLDPVLVRCRAVDSAIETTQRNNALSAKGG